MIRFDSIYNVKLEQPYFDDLPPEEKSADELIRLILLDAAGEKVSFKRYSESDINRTARKLIIGGFLRGTVICHDRCVWSKLTRKGEFLLKWM